MTKQPVFTKEQEQRIDKILMDRMENIFLPAMSQMIESAFEKHLTPIRQDITMMKKEIAVVNEKLHVLDMKVDAVTIRLDHVETKLNRVFVRIERIERHVGLPQQTLLDEAHAT